MEQAQKTRLKIQQQTKRSSSYRMRIFSLILGMVLTLMLAATAIRAKPTTLGEQQQKIFANLTLRCTARECDDQLNQQQLLTILSYMKPSADPCLDFHEYACGNWRNLHTNGTTAMKLAEQNLIKKYIDLFSRWQQDEDNEVVAGQTKKLNEVQDKMLKYYKVCRSLENSKRFSLNGYLRQMTEEFDLWRLQDFDWLKTLAQLGRFGYSSHFLQLTIHQHNATYMQLKLLPDDRVNGIRWNADVVAALEDYASKERGEALKEVLLEFERNLFSQLRSDDKKDNDYVNSLNEGDDYYNGKEFTLDELYAKTAYLTIDWQHYLSTILGRKLEQTHKILVVDLYRIKKVASFLQQQEPETIMLYTMALFLKYLQELKPNFLDVETPASSYNCIKHMRRIHYVAMNYVYELEFYSKERVMSDAVIFKMFNSLKDEFKQILQENSMHFTMPQLVLLIEKLSAMRLNIGNLPKNVTPTFYSDYVRNLNVSQDNFYHNHLQALLHFFGHKHSMFEMPGQQLSSPMHTFCLNDLKYPEMIDSSPFFSLNMIVIPFAYLDVPFYSAHFWDILLYGDLSNMLGHEIVRGFDENSVIHDGNSAPSKVLKEILWNSNFSQNRYCHNVTTLFLDEHIADVSSLKLTIRAFMRNAALKQQHWQLFFMQFAQFFCGSTDLDSFRVEDPYLDIDTIRLNYALAQTREFSEIYECPLGSKMNPEARCHTW